MGGRSSARTKAKQRQGKSKQAKQSKAKQRRHKHKQRHLRTITRGEAYGTRSSRTSGSAPDHRKAPLELDVHGGVRAKSSSSMTHHPFGPLSSANAGSRSLRNMCERKGCHTLMGIPVGKCLCAGGEKGKEGMAWAASAGRRYYQILLVRNLYGRNQGR